MKRNVLCVVELDNYPDDVVARATWLAKLYDCDLELVLSDPIMNHLGENFIYFADLQLLTESVQNDQDSILQGLAATAEKAGIAVRTSTSTDRPEAYMIASKAAACNALFVVKGTHWHSPSERASLADTDWRLIRRIESPLWFAKPAEIQARPVVVAAVDPTNSHDTETRLDHEIIRQAQGVVDKCNGKLLLFHSYQRLEEIGSKVTWKFKPEKLPLDKLDQKIREEHRNALEKLASDCGVAAGAVHQLPGRAHELLPTFARANGASLVVMGGRARSGVKHRFVGRTATRVLDHLQCDVLIVHANS
jgi:universal stress protein E